MIRFPTQVFAYFAGGAAEGLIAKELTVLLSPDLEVLLHPSDLVISGKEQNVKRARALVAEHLTFTKAYLTWTKEANAIEDRLNRLQGKFAGKSFRSESSGLMLDMQKLEKDLKKLDISHEEWEVLFREYLLVERLFWKSMVGLHEKGQAARETVMTH